MDSFNFFKEIWHYHHLLLRPPKRFLDPYQDGSQNITQPGTNRKFLHKYGYNVRNATGYWTALIFSIKSGITTKYFLETQNVS